MRLDITGRHVEVTPPLRQLIDRRLAKLERLTEKKRRRFLVRYENLDTGVLEPIDVNEDDYTKIFVLRIVQTRAARLPV